MNIDNDVICLDDSSDQPSVLRDEELQRRRKALMRARKIEDIYEGYFSRHRLASKTVYRPHSSRPSGQPTSSKPTPAPTHVRNEDIICLSDSSEEEREEGEPSSPSIITEISNGTPSILEVTDPVTVNQFEEINNVKKRPGPESESPLWKKRRFSPEKERHSTSELFLHEISTYRRNTKEKKNGENEINREFNKLRSDLPSRESAPKKNDVTGKPRIPTEKSTTTTTDCAADSSSMVKLNGVESKQVQHRRIETTLMSRNLAREERNSQEKETTSEKYLKRLKHLRKRRDNADEDDADKSKVSQSGGKSTSELIVDSLKNLETSEKSDSIASEKEAVKPVVPCKLDTDKNKGTKSSDELCHSKVDSGEPFPAASSASTSSPLRIEDDKISTNTAMNVTEAVELFLKTCEGVLPADEFSHVKKKILKYLNQLSPPYIRSTKLVNYVEMKWGLLDSNHRNVYVQIKDVLDELKKYRMDGRSGTTSDLSDNNTGKKKVVTTVYQPLRKNRVDDRDEENHGDKANLSEKEGPVDDGGDVSREKAGSSKQTTDQCSSHRQTDVKEKKKSPSKRHLLKLERALHQCEVKIRKLEQTEVNFDEEDDSVYILQAKYKKRYMDIYRKLAEYNQLSANLDRRTEKRFKFEDSRFPAINIKISKFVNRTKLFPDFLDIKKLIDEVNTGQSLGISEVQIHTEAERIFQSVGRRLKARRGNDDFDAMNSYFQEPSPIDPASVDPSLEERLNVQLKEGKKKIDKVFDEFVEKQTRAKSSDDDAEVQAGESDADDDCDDEEEDEADDESVEGGSTSEIPSDPTTAGEPAEEREVSVTEVLGEEYAGNEKDEEGESLGSEDTDTGEEDVDESDLDSGDGSENETEDKARTRMEPEP